MNILDLYIEYKNNKSEEIYLEIYNILIQDYKNILYRTIPNSIHKKYYEDLIQDLPLILQDLFNKFDVNKSIYIRSYFKRLAITHILNNCKTKYFDVYSLNRKPIYPTLDKIDISELEVEDKKENNYLDDFVLKQIRKYMPNIIKERDLNFFLLNVFNDIKIKDIAKEANIHSTVVSKAISSIKCILSKDKEIIGYYNEHYK